MGKENLEEKVKIFYDLHESKKQFTNILESHCLSKIVKTGWSRTAILRGIAAVICHMEVTQMIFVFVYNCGH